jgi:predicted small secreted protein
MRTSRRLILEVLVASAVLAAGGTARGYVEEAYALGRVVGESSNILLVRVESVDRQKNLVVYSKVRDVKGVHPTASIKHNIGQAGFQPREWRNVMAWAEPGKMAVIFHNGSMSETCIENYWYQCGLGDWWQMTHAEPYLLRSYAGKPEKLAGLVAAMLAGQEVAAPCMVDGDKNALQLRAARIQRMRVSTKLVDYNPKRDFIEFGGAADDFRAIQGMPGFSHVAALPRTGLGAAGIAPCDFNGDGKMDLCLFSASRVLLLQNAGGSFDEVHLPLEGGARAAAWADYDGDGKPDLLLATPTGPRLFHNTGKQFEDVSYLLPQENYYNLRAAAWIDYDGDGKPDILLADGFRGLRLYRNKGVASAPPGQPKVGNRLAKGKAMAGGPQAFEDVSDAVGLGEKGIAAGLKGDHLAVADVNGDGRPEFLYSAGTGVLALNTPRGFVEAKDCGIRYEAGGVAPAFGDFLGDGRQHLFVPQRGVSKLYRNDGHGHFSDVTAQAGDLARPMGQAVSAAWSDFRGSGRLDLFVACVRGPNRYFRNNGDGTFSDATEAIGLLHRVFNTAAVAVLDLNNDKMPDVVFNNEGQESTVLLGSAGWDGRAGAKPALAAAGEPPAAVAAADPPPAGSAAAAAPQANRNNPESVPIAAPATGDADRGNVPQTPTGPVPLEDTLASLAPWSAYGAGIVLALLVGGVLLRLACSRRPRSRKEADDED